MGNENLMLEQYMNIGSRLSQKWDFLVEGIEDEYTRNTTSILLENTLGKLKEDGAINLNEGFDTGDVTGINRILLPVIRRVYPHLKANNFVTVQPMLTPTTQIFYLRYRYGSSVDSLTGQANNFRKGTTKADDEFLRVPAYGDFGINPYYSSQVIDKQPVINSSNEEVVFSSGNTSYDASASTETPFVLNWYPVVNGSVSVALYEYTDETVKKYNQDGTTTDVIERTYGKLVEKVSVPDGTAVSGSTYFNGTTFNSSTRELTTKVTGAPAGTALVMNWEYTLENNKLIPEMKISIDTESVTAQTRKLKTTWSQESMQDLKALHNIDAEKEITGVISSMLLAEIDREILSDLLYNAGISETFDYTDDSGNGTQGNYLDRNQALIGKIVSVAAEIHKLGKLGPANWLVTSPGIAAKIKTARGFEASKGISNSEFEVGISLQGTIEGGAIKVFVDPYFPKNKIVMGYKGDSFLSTSYVYAPYQPLYQTPLIYDPTTLVPMRGFMSRYGKKLVKGGEYLLGRITVDHLV